MKTIILAIILTLTASAQTDMTIENYNMLPKKEVGSTIAYTANPMLPKLSCEVLDNQGNLACGGTIQS